MKKTFLASMAAAALAITTFSATAQMDMKDPMVGGAAMYPSKTIVENAVNSPIHTTLVAAVKAASLVDTLNSPAPSLSSRLPTTPSPSFPPAPSTHW